MLSLCMITRNEEQFLASCLRSVRALVDEIILTDTGSVDRTKDIARSYGAKIYEFEWADDFSAARNLSLSKASGEWIFSLDADEIIAERDHQEIKRLTCAAASACTAFSLVTRNYTHDPHQVGWESNDGWYRHEEAGCGWIPTEKVRLFPRHPKIRYEYPVHEMVEPSLHCQGVEIKSCDVPIHHYGPLAVDKDKLKMQAYYRMGKNKLGQAGDQATALRELAIQAALIGKTEEAVELWAKFVALIPDNPEAFVHLGTAYFQLKNYKAALRASQKALALNPNLKEALYNYALCEFAIGDIRNVVVFLKNLLVRSPGFLPARYVLAAAQICSGSKKEGLESLQELSRTRMGPNLLATSKDLAQRLREMNRPFWAKLIIETAAEYYYGGAR